MQQRELSQPLIISFGAGVPKVVALWVWIARWLTLRLWLCTVQGWEPTTAESITWWVCVSIAEMNTDLQKLSVHCMYRCYLMYIIQYTHLLSHVHDWHHYWSSQKTRQHDSCPAAAPRLVWQHICQQIGRYGGNWSHGVLCWAPRVWTQPLQGQYMCQDLLINGLEEQQGVHLESKCHIWYHMTDLALLIDCNSYSVMQNILPVNEVWDVNFLGGNLWSVYSWTGQYGLKLF